MRWNSKKAKENLKTIYFYDYYLQKVFRVRTAATGSYLDRLPPILPIKKDTQKYVCILRQVKILENLVKKVMVFS